MRSTSNEKNQHVLYIYYTKLKYENYIIVLTPIFLINYDLGFIHCLAPFCEIYINESHSLNSLIQLNQTNCK